MIKISEEEKNKLREMAFESRYSENIRIIAKCVMFLLGIDCTHYWVRMDDDREFCETCGEERYI